jgi:membrane-associated phospholipid phosphatase
MLSINVARALSIIGHPVLLVPCAVAGAASLRGASPEVIRTGVGASVLVAIIVAVYSFTQVRLGRWGHVDASAPIERSQLNQFLVVVLLLAACSVWWSGGHKTVVFGLAVCAAVIVFAIQTRRWLKVSLHAAFAVFAAALLWPNNTAVAIALVIAVGVSWSRLALRRHTTREVVLGWLAGSAAGLGFNLLSI